MFRYEAPEGFAFIKHYYSVEKEGRKDATIEKILANIESDVTQVIRLLIEGKVIDSYDLEILQFYLAIQTTRVPGYRDSVEDAFSGIAKHILDTLMLSGPERVGMAMAAAGLPTSGENSPDKLIKTHEQYGHLFKVTVNPDVSLRQMIDSANHSMRYLKRFDRLITVKAPGSSSFIVGDIPVMSYNARDDSHAPGASRIGLKGTIINLVLDQKTLLILGDSGKARIDHQATDEAVFSHNCYLAHFSHDFIAASNLDVLKQVIERTRIDKIEPPLMFEMG